MKKILVLTLALTLILGWSAIAGAAAPEGEFEIDYWNVSVDGDELELGYVNDFGGSGKGGPEIASYGSEETRLLNMDVEKSDSFRVETRYKNLLLGYTTIATDGSLDFEQEPGEFFNGPYVHPGVNGLNAGMNFDFNAVDLGAYWNVVNNPKYNVVFEGMLRIGTMERDYTLDYTHVFGPIVDRISSDVKQSFLGPVVGVRTNYQLGKANLYGVVRYGIMFTETKGSYSEKDVCLEHGDSWDEHGFSYSEDESFTVQELGLGFSYPLSPVLTAKAGWFSSCYSGVLKTPQYGSYGSMDWSESDLVMSGYQLGLVWKY